MNILVVVYTIVSFGLAVASASGNAPVLMFFQNEQPGNTVTVGQTLNTVEFTRLISQIKSSVDVIFVDGLRENDLRMLLKQQEMPTKNILYEPIVESPAAALSSFLASNPTIKSNIITDDIAIRALGDFMNKITSTSSDAVILTSSGQSSRNRRDANGDSQSNNTIPMQYIYGNNGACAAVLSTIYLQDQSKSIQTQNPVYLNITSSNLTCGSSLSTLYLQFPGNASVLDTNVTSMQINFVNPNGSLYWHVDNNASIVSTTTLGNLGIYYYGAPYGMETPLNFSFACTRTYYQLFNKSTPAQTLLKVYLYINYFQVQPFNIGNNGTNFTFGQVNYCQGFFSSGIWMAITSSLILTAILAFGISFLFSVNTMDRFEDPKGKPLMIAQEK